MIPPENSSSTSNGFTHTIPTTTSMKMRHHEYQQQQQQQHQQPEDADQAIVQTPYGRGIVLRTRKSDGIKEIQLLEWETFGASSSSSYQQPSMMYTSVDYPSVQPHVGDDVICAYGRGRVTQITSLVPTKTTSSKNKQEPPILKYTITLSSWRLHYRRTVTVHLTSSSLAPPRVVRKQTLLEMDAHDKVAHATSLKLQANAHFTKKNNHSLALSMYRNAVDAVRNVQHDHTSTNEVRADLIAVMVTCCNNAATCCIPLEKWEEAERFAKNALILLDALYGRRETSKILRILREDCKIVDEKLFGEWRVKSYLIIARSCLEKGQEGEEEGVVMGVLKKARGVGMEYIEGLEKKKKKNAGDGVDGDGHDSGGNCLSKEEKASLKGLTLQMKEVRRLMTECAERKKATKKLEKKRAKAMFGGGGNNKSVQEKKPREVAKTIDTANNSDDKLAKENEVQQQQQQQQQSPPSSPRKEDQEIKSIPTVTFTTSKTPNNQTSQSNTTSATFTTDESNDKENHSNAEKKPYRKKVSFSEHPPQVKEFEKDNKSNGGGNTNDLDDVPWYSEHKEAFIMVAIAGFSVFALVGLRRAFR